MSITIALAGNPNSGKSTLFNALTGSNQYVGNWPGVTVEKKTGVYKKNKEIQITDLPGVYSLSPYTLEEVVSREYLINEKPDVIVNIIDASNIERNLYLSTQLSEIGIPMVVALNMMDVVERNGDKIDTEKLSKILNCPIIEISALRNKNIDKVIETSLEVAKKGKHSFIEVFDPKVEGVIKGLEDIVSGAGISEYKRWYAVKLLERDEKSTGMLNFSETDKKEIESIVKNA